MHQGEEEVSSETLRVGGWLPPDGPDVCVTLLSVAAVWLPVPYVGSITP